MNEKRYELIFLNGFNGFCSIQDTEAEIPTFYNDLGYINSIKPVCDLLNELNDENEQLKIQIKIFEMFIKKNNLNIDWISFCGLDHLCIANDNDFKCQYCPCLVFEECFDD